MRFLCLHGTGSNSRILQQQTAAIRYELGDRHSYDFVEGSIPWETDPALKDYVLGDEKTFAYCDPTSPKSCLQLAEVLNRYVTAEGPYDGIIGFSFGACIAISWMLYLRQEGGGKAKLPFKVGIFFSNALPLSDLNALRQGQIKHLIKPPECLDLPSAHIWGAKDAGHENARLACETCSASTRAVYIHDKGHGIPTSVDDTVSMVKTINRAIMSV